MKSFGAVIFALATAASLVAAAPAPKVDTFGMSIPSCPILSYLSAVTVAG